MMRIIIKKYVDENFLCMNKKTMSCLFHSLSSYLQGIDENDLRQRICNYLETNPSLMDDLSFRDLLLTEDIHDKDYIRSMREQSTWGGALEIKAFCEIFQTAVEVRILSTGKSILFLPQNHPCPSRVRIEWQGNHYIPLPY